MESVCYQIETEWGQVGNHMQSVWDNTANNCDRLVKMSILLLFTYTDLHLKQKFTLASEFSQNLTGLNQKIRNR